jgi:hypothetical protein
VVVVMVMVMVMVVVGSYSSRKLSATWSIYISRQYSVQTAWRQCKESAVQCEDSVRTVGGQCQYGDRAVKIQCYMYRARTASVQCVSLV